MNTAMKEERNYAKENAKAWYDGICEWHHQLSDDGKEERDEQITDLQSKIEELQQKLDDYEGDRRRAPYTLTKEALEAAEKTLNQLEEFDEDAVLEEIQESPLSVQVRSGWVNPGETMEAEEYEILLSTGGPALRIVGGLNQHKEPHSASLQYQDWGTPWTDYWEADDDVLLWFAAKFSYGY